MELYNYMEDVVKSALEELFSQKKDICKCDKCKFDIAAMALNKLHPKYVVTEKGRVYTKLSELGLQSKTDILKELVKAMNIVQKKPQH